MNHGTQRALDSMRESITALTTCVHHRRDEHLAQHYAELTQAFEQLEQSLAACPLPVPNVRLTAEELRGMALNAAMPELREQQIFRMCLEAAAQAAETQELVQAVAKRQGTTIDHIQALVLQAELAEG